MKSLLLGREIPLRGPDARIKVLDIRRGDPEYYRLDHLLLTPADAWNYLREAKFSARETQDYLRSLPLEVV